MCSSYPSEFLQAHFSGPQRQDSVSTVEAWLFEVIPSPLELRAALLSNKHVPDQPMLEDWILSSFHCGAGILSCSEPALFANQWPESWDDASKRR